jgi:signal recognition particle GTPase
MNLIVPKSLSSRLHEYDHVIRRHLIVNSLLMLMDDDDIVMDGCEQRHAEDRERKQREEVNKQKKVMQKEVKEKEALHAAKENSEEKTRDAERYKKWLKDEMMKVLKSVENQKRDAETDEKLIRELQNHVTLILSHSSLLICW